MHARTHTCSEHTRPHICLASWLVDKYPIAVCQARGKKKEEEEEGPVGSRTCGTEHRGPGVDWTSGRGLVRAQPGLF